ncbi:hypothetical protein VTI28DRAFT_10039 [Corynascus sepedonium]
MNHCVPVSVKHVITPHSCTFRYPLVAVAATCCNMLHGPRCHHNRTIVGATPKRRSCPLDQKAEVRPGGIPASVNKQWRSRVDHVVLPDELEAVQSPGVGVHFLQINSTSDPVCLAMSVCTLRSRKVPWAERCRKGAVQVRVAATWQGELCCLRVVSHGCDETQPLQPASSQCRNTT